MLHFENDALAGRKPFHGTLDLLADFLAQQAFFRIRRGPYFRLAVEEIRRDALGFLWARALALRGGWCGGEDDRAPRSSRSDRATYKSCIRTGSDAGSGRRAESLPGRRRARPRGDAPSSTPSAGRRGRTGEPSPRTPAGRPPGPYGPVPALPPSFTAAAWRASPSSATLIPIVSAAKLDSATVRPGSLMDPAHLARFQAFVRAPARASCQVLSI